MATDNTNVNPVSETTSSSHADALNIQDVLSGIVPEGAEAGMLGAYLKIETVGGNTVISVEAGAPAAIAFPIVTLEGVTGVTLQDLLNNQIVT
ncbi:MAG: hypothetical protein A3G24_13485 [Betaproteobacteria bacterium RIFCSPLOWO2_12_FULL_62_13]|nr:MAG: hypothetical protein A3G24_13485 [Betaproteobacteria bacterium RIFCSPLOWO2_12_FULL_62_13]